MKKDWVFQIAHQYGLMKSGSRRAFADLCLIVTVGAATRQLGYHSVEDVYESWTKSSGVRNKTKASFRAQVSKLKVFWDFRNRFDTQELLS